jgi:hypothetical protein
MSDADVCEVKPPRRRGPSAAPRDPDKVFKIIDLHDNQGLSWGKISEDIGETRQGPYLLYKKWYDWAKVIQEEKNIQNDEQNTIVPEGD